MSSVSTANASSPQKPAHHANDSATAFRNPWDQSKGLLASGLIKFPFEWAKELDEYPAKPCKLVAPDFGQKAPDDGVLMATWLGHAGYMVQLPRDPSSLAGPVRILFDPIWSDRASPSQLAGPRRRLPPPCPLKQLPEFQFVVISHNHYDHLDWPTIEAIFNLRGSQVHFLVPLGNKSWFCSGGIPPHQVTEMDWWDEVDLGSTTSQESATNQVRFICVPAQHSSGRGLHDQRATLWASWVVKQIMDDFSVSIYHAGDTGYMTEGGPCPAFQEIGERYGPFDLAMIPIWRGGTLSFIASMGLRLASTDIIDGLHASPAHAIALHKDIRSRHSLGMHFATFAGSDIEALEPIAELADAKEKEHISDWDVEGGFGTIDVGATAIFPISAMAKATSKPFLKAYLRSMGSTRNRKRGCHPMISESS